MKACPTCRERFAGDTDDFCPHDGHRLVPIVSTDRGHRGDYDRLIGTVIDHRYVIDAKLGEGGMGVVFKAHHKVIEKPVAIKVLRRDLARDPAVVQRFLQEAKSASRIGHANIVDVMDFGTLADGAAYSVMEFIDGVTLAKALRETGRLPLHRALPIISQMCRALAAAHDKGIVHRDLKPDNVFLFSKEGRHDLVKIVDFGIAKILATHPAAGPGTPRLTRVGAIFGTPDYMAPEQAAGKADIDQRVDVYAVGTILYEMVVGQVPHRSDNPLSVLTMQLLDPITPPRQAAIGVDISDELEKVIMKALAKERDLRYRTMAELLVGLEGAAGGIPLETSIPITGQVPVVGRATSSPPIMSAISGVSPPIRARSTSSPPGMVGPPSVIFAERQSQPEIVPPSRTAERSAHMARHRSRTLMLGAMVMVGVAGAVVGIALYFGGAGDDEEAFGADAGSRAVLGQVDAAAAAGPLDGAAASTAPDAALRRAPPDARPLQVIKPPPDAALRVVSPPPPRRTINVMVLTEPPEGVIFQGDRQLPDRSMVRGLEGTQTEVRCEMFKRERTTITIRFDRDKTVFCKMPELKDPFEKVKEPEGPKEPLKE